MKTTREWEAAWAVSKIKEMLRKGRECHSIFSVSLPERWNGAKQTEPLIEGEGMNCKIQYATTSQTSSFLFSQDHGNCQKRCAGMLDLALVPSKSVIEVLARRRLRPLGVGRLLASTIAASTRRSAVAHGLRSVTGGRLRRRTTI